MMRLIDWQSSNTVLLLPHAIIFFYLVYLSDPTAYKDPRGDYVSTYFDVLHPREQHALQGFLLLSTEETKLWLSMNRYSHLIGIVT